MNTERSERLAGVHPQMLRAPGEGHPQQMGMDHRRQIGQCFEWALDRARITNQDAAYRMGYADAGVIGRWTSGLERIQLDKLRAHLGEAFWQEFVIALAQDCAGVEVTTQIALRKVG